MRIFLTILTFLVAFSGNAQQQMWWGLNPKGTLMIYQKDTKTNSNSTVHSLTGVPAGALIVLTTSVETDLHNCSVSSSPSLTWTKRADAQNDLSGDAEIWTAVYTAGGNLTVTSAWGSGLAQASTAYVVVNQESTLSGNSATASNQGAPAVDITPTKVGSILFAVTSDWNAVNGSSRAYRLGEEQLYFFGSSTYATYHYTYRVTAIHGHKMGLTEPFTMSAGTAVYEVRPK